MESSVFKSAFESDTHSPETDSNFPLRLSREEQKQLAQAWFKQKNIGARDFLLGVHYGWINRLAKNLALKNGDGNGRICWQDLAQEGRMGLIKALDTYKPDLGPLCTWAFGYVRNAMNRVVLKNKRIVVTERTKLALAVFYQRREMGKMIKGKKPDEMIEVNAGGNEIRVKVKKILELWKDQSITDFSLDAPWDPFDSRSKKLEDVICLGKENPLSSLEQREKMSFIRKKVREVLAEFEKPGRERLKDIFINCFLKRPGEGESLRDLGEKYGVSFQCLGRVKKGLEKRLQVIFNSENEDLIVSIEKKINAADLTPGAKGFLKSLLDVWNQRPKFAKDHMQLVNFFRENYLNREEERLFSLIINLNVGGFGIPRKNLREN